MDFFLKNLKETLDAINKCIEKDVYLINTKRIRRCNNVKSSDRSKINFIWRSLKFLEEEGSILEKNGMNNPKTYKIKKKEPVNIPSFISKVGKKR